MLGLFKDECYKMFRKKKLYLFFALLLANELIFVFQSKFSAGGPQQAVMNGQSFPLQMLSGSSLFIAIFMAVLVADMVSDEYRQGNFKAVLLHPIQRGQLVCAKAASLLLALVVVVAFTGLTSCLLGGIFFGQGDAILVNGAPVISHGTSLGGLRGALATVLAALGFILAAFGLTMLALFVSFLTDSSPVTIAVGASLALFAKMALGVEVLRKAFIGAFMDTLPSMIVAGAGLPEIFLTIAIAAVYAAGFYGASILLFSGKDVL